MVAARFIKILGHPTVHNIYHNILREFYVRRSAGAYTSSPKSARVAPAGLSGRVRISRRWGARLVTGILSGPLSGRRVR